MLRKSIFIVGLVGIGLLPGSHARAQAAESSAYCKLDATFEATLRSIDSDVFLKEVAAKCKRGDIVDYPGSHTYVAKKTCDFSQQILITRNEIVCVYLGSQRTDR